MSALSTYREHPHRAVVAGFCASAASGLVLLFAHIFAKLLSQSSLSSQAFGALTDNSLTALAGSNLYLAVSLHFLIGITLGVLFMKIRPKLPESSAVAGFLFMLIPFLLSILVLFPLTGGGLFGLDYGAGILPALGSLMLHGVYGLTLVGLYEKIDHAYAGEPGDDFARTTVSHQKASVGILLGAGLGLIVSAGYGFLGADIQTVAGLPRDFLFMAIIFFCSAMGLLIGFWTGLSRPAELTNPL